MLREQLKKREDSRVRLILDDLPDKLLNDIEKSTSGAKITVLGVAYKKDIDEVLKWLEDKNLKVVLTGMADGWRVADTLS